MSLGGVSPSANETLGRFFSGSCWGAPGLLQYGMVSGYSLHFLRLLPWLEAADYFRAGCSFELRCHPVE